MRSALKQRRDAVVDRSRQLAQKIDALTSPAVAELDDQIKVLRRQLRDLPGPASRPDSPTNGYHSAIYPQPDATVWVQVDLGSTVPIEEIRLVPARPTDFPDTPGFGFPARFRVEVSDDPTFARAEQVAADSHPDHLNVEDEPYVIRPRGRSARFVRVTATRLWKRLSGLCLRAGRARSDLEGCEPGPSSQGDRARFDRGRPLVAREPG